jgi:hypothetical protein
MSAPRKVVREKRERLRFLCLELSTRVAETWDDVQLGDVEGLIDEAAMLAKNLGYHAPPLERTFFDGDDPQGQQQEQPRPMAWPIYAHAKPRFLYVFGYRLSGPARGDRLVDLDVSAFQESHDPEGPRVIDPWSSESKARQRRVAITLLNRWVRELDWRLGGARDLRPPAPPAASVAPPPVPSSPPPRTGSEVFTTVEIPNAARKAGASLALAERERPDLMPDPDSKARYTKGQYEYLKEYGSSVYPRDDHGRCTLPPFETWGRHVRTYLKARDGRRNRPRGQRPGGRSVVSRKDL